MTRQGADGVARLTLLATALAARPLEVVAGTAGEPAWTNGVSVFIDEGLPAREQVRCVAVQASLLAAGSFEPELLAELRRRNVATQRYLTLEGHRALAAQADLLPASLRRLIDQPIALRTLSPATSLAIALGRDAVPPPPADFGTIRPREMFVSARARRDQDSMAATAHAPRRQAQEDLRELDDEEEIERDNPLDLLNPIGGGGILGRLLQKMLGNSRSKGSGQPGADQPTHMTGRGRGSPLAATSSSRASLPDEADYWQGRTAVYPEWNVYERRYRPDWCTVAEVEPESVRKEPLRPVGAQALRRPLARLGMELERRHRQLQGDDLDIDAVVEARAEIAAGRSPDEAFYIDSLRRRRDLSVLILLDVSGSAGEPSATGVTVHEHQRQAAAALTTALHDLGDRVALYGFRSQGRGSVQVVPVKRFSEGVDAAVLTRLGGLEPGAYTRLGAAIRHGSTVLEKDGGTARRLLLVLSDGFAYDHGYEGDYGEADARRALAEARRRGTACLCLSIGASTDAEALRRVFGTAAYAGIPRAQDLPALVGPLFRSALRLADAQRRTFQRKERTRERLQIERTSA